MYAKWSDTEVPDVTVSIGVYDQTNSVCGQGGSYTFNDEDMTHTIDKHTVAKGSQVQLVAAPADGYEFIGWFEGKVVDGTDELRIEPVGEVGSTDMSGAFNATEDVVLCAVFKVKNTTPAPEPTPEPTPTPDPTPVPVAGADPAEGTPFTLPEGTVQVTSAAGRTVVYTKAPNKKSVTVPETVVINGKTFLVTEIGSKAFRGKKIKTVTVGKNVKTIRKNAFNKSKATKMIVKTTSLTKASVKGSLKGSKIKTVQVKVGNKAQNKIFIKRYKKIFTKANAGKKAKVK